MNIQIIIKSLLAIACISPLVLQAQSNNRNESKINSGEKQLFIDIHRLEPGKVKYKDVAAAHVKDLSVQSKYNVSFEKFWVDEKKGLVYCLSTALDSGGIRKTHKEAHGLLPAIIYPVTGGLEAPFIGKNNLFLDIHELGKGMVSATDVENAHKKDLQLQDKYGVNFINYWVDVEEGLVICLSQAKDSSAIINTHKESHGLLPTKILKVRQGE